MVKRRSLW